MRDWAWLHSQTDLTNSDSDRFASRDGTAWESENGEPIVDMMQNLCDVLARLDRRGEQKHHGSGATASSV